MTPKSNNKKKDSPANSSGRASRVSLSPRTSGTKRKQEEEDGEPARRVSRRTEEESWKESMKKILQHAMWKTDTDVVVKAMNDLFFILIYAGNDNNNATERRKHFFLLGGHAVVVGVMNAHPDLKKLQEYGICVLACTSCGSEELREAIVEVGGLEAILTVMEKFHLDGDIQFVGTRALWHLLESNEANTDLFVTKHGGIPFLLQRMESCPNNVELIQRSCMLLKEISLYDKFRKSLVDAKAVSALARAFEHHNNNDDIGKMACRVIQNLTKTNDE